MDVGTTAIISNLVPLLFRQHLEQEKHDLRWRLENREGEWEGRVAELETDIQQLQGELEQHQVQLREADRDKTKAISELSEQNHRLLEQLRRVRNSPCAYLCLHVQACTSDVTLQAAWEIELVWALCHMALSVLPRYRKPHTKKVHMSSCIPALAVGVSQRNSGLPA